MAYLRRHPCQISSKSNVQFVNGVRYAANNMLVKSIETGCVELRFFFQRQIKTAQSIYFRLGRSVGMVGPERHDNFQPNACSRATAMPHGSSPRHRPAVASVPSPHSLRHLARAEDIDVETTARAPFLTSFLPIQLSVQIRQLSDGLQNRHKNRDFQQWAVNRLKWQRLTGQQKMAGLTTLIM